MSTALRELGRYEEALDASGAEWSDDPEVRAVLAREGPERAMYLVAKRLEGSGTTGPNELATRFAMAGDADEALRWLEQGFAERRPSFLHALVDPRLAPMRSDPRYEDLLQRMGLTESVRGLRPGQS